MRAESAFSSQRSFGLLWAAVDLSSLGGWLLLPAVVAWGYQGHESAATVSVLLLAWFFPAFALRPLANAIANGRSGKAVAIVALLARAAALLPLMNARGDDTLASVGVALALSGMAAAFAEASFGPLLRSLASGKQLEAAEGAMANGKLLAMIAGGAASTALYVAGALQAVAPAGIAAIVLSAALLLLARFPGSNSTTQQSNGDNGPLSVQRGLLLSLRHPALQEASAVKLVAALATGGILVPQVAYMILGVFTAPENVGLIISAQGVGMLVASATYRFVADRYPRNSLVALALGLASCGIFAFTLSGSIAGAMAFSLAIGAGLGVLSRSLFDLQTSVAGAERSASISDGLGWAAEAPALLSMIALGPLTDLLSPRLALALSAVILATLALYAFGAITKEK